KVRGSNDCDVILSELSELFDTIRSKLKTNLQGARAGDDLPTFYDFILSFVNRDDLHRSLRGILERAGQTFADATSVTLLNGADAIITELVNTIGYLPRF